MAIHAALDQIHQRARAEIQQKSLIRLHQVAGRRPGRMDIGTGAENSQTHRSPIVCNSDGSEEMINLTPQAAQELFEPQSNQD